jgi:copper chaperone
MHTFTVNDMSCGGCASAITQSITHLDPTAVVQADPATKLIRVESQKPASEIVQAIAAAGYHAME